VIGLSRQQAFRQGVPGGPVEKGFASKLLDEKSTWRVPISDLVLLSLACGSGAHDLMLKEPQF